MNPPGVGTRTPWRSGTGRESAPLVPAPSNPRGAAGRPVGRAGADTATPARLGALHPEPAQLYPDASLSVVAEGAVDPAAPEVSVVICAYTEERWDDLAAAVTSVRRQSVSPREIIAVIDHNPRLLARARACLADVVVVENREARGLAGARNSGVAAACGAIVAFLDDDAVARPDWLEHLRAGYARPEVFAVGGAIAPVWAGGRPRWFPEEFDWIVGCTYRGMAPTTAAVRNLIGANMSFRREVFEAIGGFRVGLGRVGQRPLGCEETEFCIRAGRRWPRGVCLYEPRARVQHRVPASRARWRYFRSRCYAEGRSKALVARSVGARDGLATERDYTVRTLPLGVARGLADALLRRDPGGLGRAGAIVAGLLLTTTGYLAGGVARRFATREGTMDSARCLATRHANGAGQRLPAAAARPDTPRVLLVTARYFPFMGGVENHVYQVARRLAARGVTVTVLTTDPSGRLPAEEEREGVRIRRVRAWPANRDYYFAPGIYRAIVRGRWDVVHCQCYHTLVPPLAMLAALRARAPYVVTFHGGGHSSRVRNALRPVQYALLRPLLARAARLVATARFEIPFFGGRLRLPEERFAFIPNGSDLASDLAEVAPPSAAMADGTVIASLGRLERYKGHHRILAALPKILEQQPDARLWIAGAGPFEPTLRRMARDLGVAERVEIRAIPVAERATMAAELSRVALAVLLSEYETHPMAALEALALGCPLLVADTSGLRELAEQGLARAIPLRSTAEQVAAAVLDQLRRPPIPRAVDLPTWDSCAADLLTLYQTVAGGQPCAS